MSVNIYQSGSLVRVAGRSVMDAELNASSANGVRNSVVTAALNAKQPKTMSTTIAGQTTVEGCLSTINANLTGLTSTVSAIGIKKSFNFSLTAGAFTAVSTDSNWHYHKYYAIFHGLNNDVCHFYIRRCETEGQMTCEAMSGGAFTEFTNFALQIS